MASVWQKEDRRILYPSLKKDLETEVLVVGGGMAGVLCARKLQDAGKQVVLAEAERIGCGITARTTAVLTAQHDYLYQDMISRFGEETARAYLHGNLEAVKEFREMAKKIPCDFETVPSVQFTAEEPSRLKKEAQTVKQLGFPASFTEQLPLDVPARGAVVYPDMAQFHPLKFLVGAAEGLQIYEQSRVLDLDGTTAILEKGKIKAEKVIVATHFPFLDRRGLYFMKLYQNRSYVLALENVPRLDVTLAELEGQGLYFRSYGELLLMGGGDHRTGKQGGGLAYLRRLARQYFPEVQLGAAAMVVLPYLLLTGGCDLSAMTGGAWMLLLIVGIVHTGIAYTLYFGALQKLSAQTAAVFSYIDPVAAVLLSALLLKESLDLVSIIGAILVLGSALYSELPERKPRKNLKKT